MKRLVAGRKILGDSKVRSRSANIAGGKMDGPIELSLIAEGQVAAEGDSFRC